MCVWDLEGKILNSVPLSPEEMRLVQRALVSGKVSETVLACEALLRLGDEQERHDAIQALSRIVREINTGALEPTSNLLMALFSVPEAVLNQPDFQIALKSAAAHTDDGVRGNCMIALGPLAKAGINWAEDLLNNGLRDSNEHVRQNARASLRLVHNRKI